jgi:hypothetical protein
LLKKADFSHADICNEFGTLLQELSNGKLVLTEDVKLAMTIGAVLYIVGTKSYQISLSLGLKKPQFLVLRYHDFSRGNHILRPVPLTAEDYLSKSEIEVVVEEVLKCDRVTHPDRFKRAKVIPFKFDTLNSSAP